MLTIANVVLLPERIYCSSRKGRMASDSMQGSSGPGSGMGTGSTQARGGERRANQRYELTVEFDLFHLFGAKHLIWAGAGRTRNWSRNSILIEWEKPLPPGTSVELVVRWTKGVQLVVVGRVLTNESRGTVVRILRRRFRGKPDLVDIPRDAKRKPAPPSSHEQAS
jgi:hypothetical protein